MIDFTYKNESNRMVVLRCIGHSKFFLERVLFPLEVYTFMAPHNSKVEIWGNQLYGPKLYILEYLYRIEPSLFVLCKAISQSQG